MILKCFCGYLIQYVLDYDNCESSVEQVFKILLNICTGRERLGFDRSEVICCLKSFLKSGIVNDEQRKLDLRKEFKKHHRSPIIKSEDFHRKWKVSPTVDRINGWISRDDPISCAKLQAVLNDL